MTSLEPSWRDIFYTYCAGVVGTYAGGVASLFVPTVPELQTLSAGLGGVSMLIVVKVLHTRAAIILLLAAGLLLPAYPAYYMMFDDPYPVGTELVTVRAVNLRTAPRLNNAEVTAVLPAGTEVIVSDRNWRRVYLHRYSGEYYNFWRLVDSPAGEGWVYGGYLERP